MIPLEGAKHQFQPSSQPSSQADSSAKHAGDSSPFHLMAAPRIGSRGPWFWATRQAKACIKSSPERQGHWIESKNHWMKSDDLQIPRTNLLVLSGE